MKKIISLFQRNYDGDRQVRNEVTPGAEWVVAGEGIATRKFDGTCCKILGGQLFKRYDAKAGKTPHADFVPAQDPDPITKHWPGWISVENTQENKYHREAFQRLDQIIDGTYELCGPKVQSNPEGYSEHVLIRHGSEVLEDCPRTFAELKEYLRPRHIEGIVWHHPDGRMVKIKAKDFGHVRK